MIRHCFIAALLAAGMAGAVLVTEVAGADKNRKGRIERDHDDVWSARRDETILALPQVLAMVGSKIDGEIIETEFEVEHGRPVYEFKYVDGKGRVRELYVDARTGAILQDKPD